MICCRCRKEIRPRPQKAAEQALEDESRQLESELSRLRAVNAKLVAACMLVLEWRRDSSLKHRIGGPLDKALDLIAAALADAKEADGG